MSREFAEKYYSKKEIEAIYNKLDKKYDPEIKKVSAIIKKVNESNFYSFKEGMYLLGLLKSKLNELNSNKLALSNEWEHLISISEGKVLFSKWMEIVASKELSTKELNLLRMYRDKYKIQYANQINKVNFLKIKTAGFISWNNINKSLTKIEYYKFGAIKKI